MFQDFLVVERAPETVGYLLEVARFRRTRSKVLRNALAERIVSQYIEEKVNHEYLKLV